jgi:hypothetical protein
MYEHLNYYLEGLVIFKVIVVNVFKLLILEVNCSIKWLWKRAILWLSKLLKLLIIVG